MADYVMSMLNLIPLISGLRLDFLGLTLLAWGNSLGDFFANSALAKRGYGLTAVTGCFAGQLFNLLVGFGKASLNSARVKTIDFDLFNLNYFHDNGIKIIVMGFAFLNLLMTFAYLNLNRWKISRGYSRFLYGFYGVFVVSAVIFQVGSKAQK